MMKISCRDAAHVVLSEVFCRVMPGAQWLGGGQSPRGFYSDFLLEQACPEELTVLLQEEYKRVIKEGKAFRSLEMMSHNLAALLKSRGRHIAAEILLATPNTLVSVLQYGESFGLAPLPHLLDADEMGEVAILDAFFVGRDLPGVGSCRVLRVTGEIFSDVKEKKQYAKARAALEKRGDGISRAKRFGFLEENFGQWVWRKGGVLLRQTLLQWWSKVHHEAGYDLAEVLGEDMPLDGSDKTLLAHEVKKARSFAQIKPFFHEGAFEHLGIYDPKWGLEDETCVFCSQEDLEGFVRASLHLLQAAVYCLKIPTYSLLTDSKRTFFDTSKLLDISLLAAAEKNTSEGKAWRLDLFFLDSLGALWPGPFVEVTAVSSKEKAQGKSHFCVRHALFGSLERMMAILLEKPLPLWMAPCQVLLVPLREKDKRQAQSYAQDLRVHGIQVEVECSAASLSERLSRAFAREIPMVAILGAKEQENGVLAVSFYGEEGELSVTVEELVKIFKHKQSTSLK